MKERRKSVLGCSKRLIVAEDCGQVDVRVGCNRRTRSTFSADIELRASWRITAKAWLIELGPAVTREQNL
jgi:hypothetical protein